MSNLPVQALRYAASEKLLKLYGVVFVGFAVRDWNLLQPLRGPLYVLPETVVRWLFDLSGLLTELAGFLITAIGIVAILETVLEDVVERINEQQH